MLMQHNLHLLGMVAASILAVAPTDAFAQAKVGEQTPVTVNVTTAGTLNTLVTSDQKFTTTSLVVKGDLNGADILFLREMAGSDKKGVATEGKLTRRCHCRLLLLCRYYIKRGKTPQLCYQD